MKFSARGHENIRGVHKTTFEFTKEKELTLKGDCIIGVNADFDFNLAMNPFQSGMMLSDHDLISQKYNMHTFEINADHFIAQNRNRGFIIGIKKEFNKAFVIDVPEEGNYKVKYLLKTLEDYESHWIVKNHQVSNHSEERIKGFRIRGCF